MSRYPGTSRSLGPVKQCAVYVRGGMRCAWCAMPFLERKEATVDHLDGDHGNNAPENLVPACWACNGARKGEWPSGVPWSHREASSWEWWGFDVHLAERGVSTEEAIARVELQRWEPLPREEGRELAERWHAERLESERRRNAARWTRRKAAQAEEREERRAIRGDVALQEVSFP